MKILILTPEFAIGGGIATFYRRLVPALVAAGASVRVIEGSAFHAGAPVRREWGGATTEVLDRERLLRWWERFAPYASMPRLRMHLAAAWAIWEQADRGAGADVVEATDWGLLFVPAAVEGERPLVVQGHGSIGQISTHDPAVGEEAQGAFVRLLESALLPRCTFQTLSRANAEFWRLNAGCSASALLPAWAPGDQRLGESPSRRGLVVGRVQRWKGPHILCEAVRLLGQKAPEFDWVGRDMPWSGDHLMASHRLVQSYPDVWGARILQHRNEPPAEIAQRQARAAFNVVPSTWDVFNFTAVEAMASGRPTIVSSGAGASELVTDGENGFVFRNEDADDLAGKVDQLLSLPPERQREIGTAAQETVRSGLDPARAAEARRAAYRETIACHQAAPPEPLPAWLPDVCRPAPQAAGASLGDYLHQLPMRALATHLGRWAAAKAAGAFSRGLRR